MPKGQSSLSYLVRDRQVVLGCFRMYLLCSDEMIGGG